jgi:hypothetical protein
MLAWRQHQAVGTCGARGVGDDLSDRFCPTQSPARVRDLSPESTAAAGRLALALWDNAAERRQSSFPCATSLRDAQRLTRNLCGASG